MIKRLKNSKITEDSAIDKYSEGTMGFFVCLQIVYLVEILLYLQRELYFYTTPKLSISGR